MKMQQMLRAMGQKDLPELKPTIEINPDHEIVKKLLARSDDAVAEDAAWLLFDQALLMEGAPLQDSAVFVQRLNRMLNLSFSRQSSGSPCVQDSAINVLPLVASGSGG